MRSALFPVLIAICLLTGCATTPTASEPRISLLRPSECLSACPDLPAPSDPTDIGVALWTLDLIDAAAECRRMHETCRTSKD